MTERDFSIETTAGQKEGTLILRLLGPLTLRTMLEFQAEFRAMKPPVLIVDMSGSPFMDSAGLGLLVNQHVSAERGNRKFLLSGVNYRIAEMFQATGVHTVLSIFPTVAEAEASLG